MGAYGHVSNHKVVFGRWILQRGVKNWSEGHCLGTPEKKEFVAGIWQVAPQSWQEKLPGYIFLHVVIVTEPKLRAPANSRVRWLPCCCPGKAGGYPIPRGAAHMLPAPPSQLMEGVLPDVPTALLSSSLWCQHSHTGKTVSQDQLVSVGAE